MPTERTPTDPLVVAVLAAAAAPAEAPLPGEAAALAAFRRAHAGARRSRLLGSVSGARFAVAGLLGGLVMAGGVATAATGNLGTVASLVGVHHSTGASGSSDATTDTDEPAAATGESYAGEVPADAPGMGGRISDLARSTETTNVDKGATVCTAASRSTCRAGQHGKPTDPGSTAGTHRQGHPQVVPPKPRPSSGAAAGKSSSHANDIAVTHEPVRP